MAIQSLQTLPFWTTLRSRSPQVDLSDLVTFLKSTSPKWTPQSRAAFAPFLATIQVRCKCASARTAASSYDGLSAEHIAEESCVSCTIASGPPPAVSSRFGMPVGSLVRQIAELIPPTLHSVDGTSHNTFMASTFRVLAVHVLRLLEQWSDADLEYALRSPCLLHALSPFASWSYRLLTTSFAPAAWLRRACHVLPVSIQRGPARAAHHVNPVLTRYR